jgi:hypothetical protein
MHHGDRRAGRKDAVHLCGLCGKEGWQAVER